MAGKQVSNFSTRELAIQRELGHPRKVPCPKQAVGTTARSPRFKHWTNNNTGSSSMHKGPTSSPKVQYPLKFARPPTPSPKPQNPVGVILIKDEPYTEDTPPPPKPNPNTNPRQPFQNPSPFPSKPRSELKRKAPENNQQQQQQLSLRKPMDSLVCELCQASCSSARTMQQHLNGRPHKAKLEWSRLKRSGKAKHMCDVCGIWCSDKDALAMHFKGQKHKAKLREVEMCAREGVGAVDKKPIMCELCGVSSMNEDSFALHLKGRQHVAKQGLNHWGME